MNRVSYQSLPNDLFMVKVPIVATYEEREITTFGLPVSIDQTDGVYMDTYKELTTVMLPISRIIDIYISGYPIHIVNKDDIIKIYEIIDEYMSGTNQNSMVSINREIVEEDRMDDIVRFAKEILNINRETITNDVKKQIYSHGFDLGMELMEDISISESKIGNYNSSLLNYNKNVNHVPYQPVSGPNVEINIAKGVDDYFHIYDGLPNVNINRASHKRRSSYVSKD